MLRGWRQFQDAKQGWTLANIQAALRDV